MLSPTGLIHWLSKLREILTLLCRITLSSSREKPTQCSRGIKKDFWHRCRGDSCQVKSRFDSRQQATSGAISGESMRKSRHYLSFASRFPLPHFTLAVLFALSFPFASFSLASCFLVCWFACLPQWLYLDLLTFTLKG